MEITDEMVRAGERILLRQHGTKAEWVKAILEVALSAAPTPPEFQPRTLIYGDVSAIAQTTEEAVDYIDRGYMLLDHTEDKLEMVAPTPLGQEQEILKVIDERDQYHEWANKLADAIAERLGVEIGEHSNLNSPWENALAFIEATPPEVEHVAMLEKRCVDLNAENARLLVELGKRSAPPSADDELRKAAEEFVALTERQLAFIGDEAYPAYSNLRAALRGNHEH